MGRVQAAARGKMARKKVKKKKKDKKKKKKKSAELDEDEAATQVQAVARGKLARKRVDGLKHGAVLPGGWHHVTREYSTHEEWKAAEAALMSTASAEADERVAKAAADAVAAQSEAS